MITLLIVLLVLAAIISIIWTVYRQDQLDELQDRTPGSVLQGHDREISGTVILIPDDRVRVVSENPEN